MAYSSPPQARRWPRVRRILFWGLALGLLLGLAGLLAFRLSPRPGVALIRYVFDRGSAAASAGLEKHLPDDVAERHDVIYDPADPDARLDLFFPATLKGTREVRPTLVWIHGGAWVSGDENQIANYARIVASRGFTVASVNYTIAPEGRYPKPLRQAHAALAHLAREGPALHVDATRLFLAGDSAGAQLAAQLATALTSPAYAEAMRLPPALPPPGRLAGVALFCGAYDLEAVSLEGPFGSFLRTVLWAYSGTKNFKADPAFATFSVAPRVTPAFPPAFITAGNADPLLPQSIAFADRLEELGVSVDRLFFPADHQPPLPHEYQFTLDHEAGRAALDRLVTFLSARAAAAP